jgi:transcriptional regulator with XRE-family HTH domain
MRTDRRLTQAELARRSGVPRTAINAYEAGRRVPTAATLLRLAEACDMRLDVVPRARLDLAGNDRQFQMALDLAEVLPTRRRGALTFPGLPR